MQSGAKWLPVGAPATDRGHLAKPIFQNCTSSAQDGYTLNMRVQLLGLSEVLKMDPPFKLPSYNPLYSSVCFVPPG